MDYNSFLTVLNKYVAELPDGAIFQLNELPGWKSMTMSERIRIGRELHFAWMLGEIPDLAEEGRQHNNHRLYRKIEQGTSTPQAQKPEVRYSEYHSFITKTLGPYISSLPDGARFLLRNIPGWERLSPGGRRNFGVIIYKAALKGKIPGMIAEERREGFPVEYKKIGGEQPSGNEAQASKKKSK